MNNTDTNKDFIVETLSDTILKMQVRLSEQAANLADFGFVDNTDYYCVLSIISLLEHALDNAILYNNNQWNNILLLYNKISHA